MVFRHHREIDAWKLAHQLRVKFIQLLKKPEIRRDFARFVNFSRGSLGELLDSTDEALAAEFITSAEYQVLNKDIDRALQVTEPFDSLRSLRAGEERGTGNEKR